MAKLPDKLKVFHGEYSLVKEDAKFMADTEAMGSVAYARKVITYVDTKNTETVDTIIHELLHVLCHGFHLSSSIDDEEEHVVATLATGLTMVMKDNPELFPALQKMVNHAV